MQTLTPQEEGACFGAEMAVEQRLPICRTSNLNPPGLTSRRSQPPLAASVPPSRFTSRVGGGSAFYVRPHSRIYENTNEMDFWRLHHDFNCDCRHLFGRLVFWNADDFAF